MFLVWCVVLLLCCLVPPYFALRQRRLHEAQLAAEEQQATLFFFRVGHRSANPEVTQQERFQVLMEILKETTLKVSKSDFKHLDVLKAGKEQPDCDVTNPGGKQTNMDVKTASASEDVVPQTNEISDKDASIVVPNDNPEQHSEEQSNVVLLVPLPDHDSSADSTKDDEERGNTNDDGEEANANITETRQVANNCAICLCPYQVGEQVTFAAFGHACSHAFHTDCIVPWLSKKTEPACPVCRQPFCPTPTLSRVPSSVGAEDDDAVVPPSLLYQLMSENFGIDETGEEAGTTVTTDSVSENNAEASNPPALAELPRSESV